MIFEGLARGVNSINQRLQTQTSKSKRGLLLLTLDYRNWFLQCGLWIDAGKNFGVYILNMTSMFLALLTASALLAPNEAIRRGQSKGRQAERRARRSNLIVRCVAPSPRSVEIDHRQVALKDSKVAAPPS